MLRLKLIGAVDTLLGYLAHRLRGVTLVDGSAVSSSTGEYDAAFVAVLADGDGRTLERLLAAGKHVLVPIDIGLPAAALQGLADQGREAMVRFDIGNPDRYLPSRQLIRQQLDAGKLGEPGLIRIHRWQPASSRASLLWDLDLLSWYFGKAPNLVRAIENARSGSVQVHCGFAGGGMAMIDHLQGPAFGDGYYSLTLIGSTGAAYADDHQNMQVIFRGGTSCAVKADNGILALAALLQDFVDSIVSKRDLAPGIDQWHKVFAVKQAIDESLATRLAISVSG